MSKTRNLKSSIHQKQSISLINIGKRLHKFNRAEMVNLWKKEETYTSIRNSHGLKIPLSSHVTYFFSSLGNIPPGVESLHYVMDIFWGRQCS